MDLCNQAGMSKEINSKRETNSGWIKNKKKVLRLSFKTRLLVNYGDNHGANLMFWHGYVLTRLSFLNYYKIRL